MGRASGHTKKELKDISEAKKTSVLEAITDLASVSAACKKCKIPRSTFYTWLEGDKDFRLRYKKALRLGTKALEDEAIRRAFVGVSKPIFQYGELVGYEKRYSDTLLMFMLKALAPNKYKERTLQEQTGKDGGPIQNEMKISVEFKNFTKKKDE